MTAKFIPGISKFRNTNRTPSYMEDDHLLIVVFNREFWFKLSPMLQEQLYEWF